MGVQGGSRLVNDLDYGESVGRFGGPATSDPAKIGGVECLLKIPA